MRQIRKVLIVPLWNWNAASQQPQSAAASSNRTFMELKYEWEECIGSTTNEF